MPDAVAPQPPHPLLFAAKAVVSDLLSTLVFVGLYAVTHSVYAAVGLGVAVGVWRIASRLRRRIAVDAMQWLSLFLVIVFGGAALITHNPLFILLKPTLVYAAIGAVMLKRGWMTRYVPAIVQTHAADLTFLFGYLWAGLMFATAAVNLLLALHADTTTWAWFIGVFPIASKIVLILVQYLVIRTVVRSRIRGARLLAMPAV